MTFFGLTIYIDTLRRSDNTLTHDIATELNLKSDFDPFPEFREIFIGHLKRCTMPMGNVYSSRHLAPPILDLHMLYIETLLSQICHSCRTLKFEHPPVLSTAIFVFPTDS